MTSNSYKTFLTKPYVMKCEKLFNKEPFLFLYLFTLFRLYSLIYEKECCTRVVAGMYIVYWRNSFLVHSACSKYYDAIFLWFAAKRLNHKSGIQRRAWIEALASFLCTESFVRGKKVSVILQQNFVSVYIAPACLATSTINTNSLNLSTTACVGENDV